MKNRITILGGGVWGQALCRSIEKGGADVLLWNRTTKPGMTSDIRQALSFSKHIIVALSVQHVREVFNSLRSFPPEICVVASKGIEQTTGLLLSEVAAEVLPSCAIGVIGGPNLASEVHQGLTCGLTVASEYAHVQNLVRSIFAPSAFILEFSRDVIGVQSAGAMKNVMAIGYGLLQQTCDSENLWASYIVLALKEMKKLITALGGYPETLFSFAGIGDLILTSSKGRNSQFGRSWPKGEGALVEGVPTTSAILKRAHTLGLDLPITQGINRILNEQLDLSQWPHYLAQVNSV